MIQSQLSLGALAVLVASVAGQNSSQPCEYFPVEFLIHDPYRLSGAAGV